MKRPLFSIIYPTRNRPFLLRFGLECMNMQNFDDFEVIVSDNHQGKSSKNVFDKYSDDKRFRYFVPPKELPMFENWEYALSKAQGEYISVITDKIVLIPSSLKNAYDAIKKFDSKIINWWEDNYHLTKEDPINSLGYDQGSFGTKYTYVNEPQEYDPKKELSRRLSFGERRGFEGTNYYRGKICFGVYRRDLIQQIKKKLGRLFFPVSPDYTSLTAALLFADSAVDLGEPLQLAFNTSISNGQLCADNADYALRFLKETDPTLKILDNFPIKGLYSSQHNNVAGDYSFMYNLIEPSENYLKLNLRNLLLRAKEDLYLTNWNNENEKKLQYNILNHYINNLDKKDIEYLNNGFNTFLSRQNSQNISAKSILKNLVIKVMGESFFKKQVSLIDMTEAVVVAENYYENLKDKSLLQKL